MTAAESGRSLKSAATRAVRMTAVGGGGRALIEAAELVLLARLLGPTAFGLMAMVLIIIGMCRILAGMGLADSLVQRKTLSKDEFNAVYWINNGLAIAVYLVLVASKGLIADIVNMPAISALVPWAGAILVLESAGAGHRALLRRELRFGGLAVIDVTSTLVGAVAAVLVALLVSPTVWALITGVVIRSVISNVVLVMMGISSGWAGRPVIDIGVARPFLGFGGYKAGAMVFNYFGSKSDQLLLGALLGSHQLGIYNMAVTLVREPIRKLNPVVTQVAFPLFSRVQDSPARLRSGYLKMLELVAFVNAPVIFGLAAVAPVAVPVLLGPEWTGAVILIQILAVYGLFSALGNATGALFWAGGYARWSFYWNMATAAVKPIIVTVAAIAAGAVGVAISVAALVAALFPISYMLRLRSMIGASGAEITRSVGLVALNAMGMAAVVGTVGAAVDLMPIPKLGTMIFAGICVYCGLAFLTQRRLLTTAMSLVRRQRSTDEQQTVGSLSA